MISKPLIEERLSAVADGRLGPVESLHAVRLALRADDGLENKVYAALADVVWLRLRSLDMGGDLGAWSDVIHQASSFCKRHGHDGIGIKLGVLVELVNRSARFRDYNPASGLGDRPYLRAILEYVERHPGTGVAAIVADRQDTEPVVRKRLSILAASGWLSLSGYGDATIVSLTNEGKAALAARRESGDHPPATSG